MDTGCFKGMEFNSDLSETLQLHRIWAKQLDHAGVVVPDSLGQGQGQGGGDGFARLHGDEGGVLKGLLRPNVFCCRNCNTSLIILTFDTK